LKGKGSILPEPPQLISTTGECRRKRWYKKEKKNLIPQFERETSFGLLDQGAGWRKKSIEKEKTPLATLSWASFSESK